MRVLFTIISTASVLLLLLLPAAVAASSDNSESPIERRLALTKSTDANPFAFAAYKSNYALPLTLTSNPTIEDGQAAEIKFQFSMMIPIWSNIKHTNAFAAFAYTNQSYWQAYNSKLSSPFTETNHEPELFVVIPYDKTFAGFRHRGLSLGLSHQSNGRSPPFSRSWNRAYVNFVFERKQIYYSLQIWRRFSEEEKTDPLQAEGDDNPDIEDFMGNFELQAFYKRGRHNFSATLRNNLSSSQRGALQLEYDFPITDKLKLTTQFFHGYGESLITYNEKVSRIGIGFRLSNWLY